MWRRVVLAAVVVTLAAPQATAEVAPARTIEDGCAGKRAGKLYYAKVKYRLTDEGRSGSSYYISVFGTGGEPIDSVRFVFWQGMRTKDGIDYVHHGIMEKRDLQGNTSYVVGPDWTGHTFVYITPNESLDGSRDEKTAILDIHMTVAGKEFGCRVVTRQ